MAGSATDSPIFVPSLQPPLDSILSTSLQAAPISKRQTVNVMKILSTMTIKQRIGLDNLKHAVLIYNLMILKDWLFDKFVRNLFICYVTNKLA